MSELKVSCINTNMYGMNSYMNSSIIISIYIVDSMRQFLSKTKPWTKNFGF